MDLANDILGVVNAWLGEAGEPNYHPDGDVNRDGGIDLPNDILGVIQQYQDDCEADHYSHS